MSGSARMSDRIRGHSDLISAAIVLGSKASLSVAVGFKTLLI